ncbi:hypothetical protein [Nocardiopsis kunsanensis]|uniref:YtxH domain-containing protein n=1 Tax=Nocardiopsis kunsanensis TaxID=141693 RepID=A0A918X639_9ACTN|nr:hypothetical protein [Nocardiopsis kunsanensis]GHD14858.1 hypothetical protein GCM10007147_01350 [Nocardiopsis kunsanensis]
MRYRITFAAGLAIGYVLGAKAGRARYDQLARTARKVADNPAVQEAAGVVGAQVSNAGRTVYDKAVERMPVTSVRDFLARPTDEELDLVRWESHMANGSAPGGDPGRGEDREGRAE